MEYLQILLTSLLIVQAPGALRYECPFGTCSLRWTDNCTVIADMMRVDENKTFCNGHGMVIAKAGLDKPSCACFTNYYGAECQFDYTLEFNCTSSDECHGGVCNDTKCEQCPPGWRGQRCEIETISSALNSTPCENGGSPYTLGNKTGCVCACGFEGVTCSEMTSSVVTDPNCDRLMCNGRGVCKFNPDTDTAYCDCYSNISKGPYGQFCQYTVTEPTPPPTETKPVSTTSSSTVTPTTTTKTTPPSAKTTSRTTHTTTAFTDVTTDVCSANRPCLNGGSCVSIGGIAKRCICSCGYQGSNCEFSLDSLKPFYVGPCRYIPCLNNGTCARTADGCDVECKCLPLFIGTYCEIAVKTTTKSPTTPCKARFYDCTTDRDCVDTKVCKTMDECGSTKCEDFTITGADSVSNYTLYAAIIMTAFILVGIAICACYSRKYFKQLCAREISNARAQDFANPTGVVRIHTISGAHISFQDLSAGSSTDREGLPTYDEACEKPPNYSDVVNGYRAMFERPGTRVQSISD